MGAAVDTVAIATAMDGRAMLYEAHALTVDVLTMAATVLLFVQTCAPGDELATRARISSGQARVLLEILARQNCAAARCLEALTVSIFSHDRERAYVQMNRTADAYAQPLFEHTTATASRSSSNASIGPSSHIVPDLQAHQLMQPEFLSAATQSCTLTQPSWDLSQENYSSALIYDPTDLEQWMTEPMCGPMGYPFDMSV